MSKRFSWPWFRIKNESRWNAVVDDDNIELGEALISTGVPFEDVVHAKPKNPATLEWAKRVGLRVESVAADCNKDVLIRAAELQIPPTVPNHYISNGCEMVSYIPGFRALCNQPDFDVIKAYFEAELGDEFDPPSAIMLGRKDFVALYKQHGLSEALTKITGANSKSFIDEKSIAVIPKGIVRIEDGAFHSKSLKGVRLSDTVEHIGSNNFQISGTYNCSVLLPKSVRTVSERAFCGTSIESITFYDQLDGRCIESMVCGSMIGRIDLEDCEFTVLSSLDDSIRFKVWRPDRRAYNESHREFEQAWKPDCSYDFAVVDKLYPKLKTPEARLHTAINRLTWPIDLDAKTAKKYQRYVSQNLDTVMEVLCSLDDPNRLNAVLSFDKLSDEQIERFKALAKKKKARAIRKALEDKSLSQAGNNDTQEKPKEKKLTVAQLVTMVCDALDEGDESKIETLRPVVAKVPMADCVELLERAAANCSGETIDALYEMFAPFECVSSALLVALFSGNVSTAKALVKHGADLDGNLIYIDEKRTPRAKQVAREKRYSHGFMTGVHTSGHILAHSLRDALTVDQGELVSRTKMGKDMWKRPTKVVVNKASNERAADTLIAISKEEGFKKSIATRLLWNFISFDARDRRAHFDAKNARKILKAEIIDEDELASLPWDKAIDGWNDPGDVRQYRLVRDYASPEQFARCWHPRFAKPVEEKGYAYIDILLLFIDVLDSDNCSNQIDVLRALTHEGKLKQLKKLAAKPGWFTRQRVKTLLNVAGDSGQTEITAWLLDLSEKDHKPALPGTLEL